MPQNHHVEFNQIREILTLFAASVFNFECLKSLHVEINLQSMRDETSFHTHCNQVAIFIKKIFYIVA